MTNACGGNQQLSKEGLLALLGAASATPIRPGDTVEYTDQGVSRQLRVVTVARDTVTLATKSGNIVVARSSVRSNVPGCILDRIPLDHWHIRSFDPRSRLVCIDVDAHGGSRHLAVYVPAPGRSD